MNGSVGHTPLCWLHLSDLHLGAPGRGLWWQVHQEFKKSLREKMEQIGPPDLILMTGDLTWRGQANEFVLVDQFLNELLGWLRACDLNSNPVVVPVPGNHDLIRPDMDDPQYVALDYWEQGRDNRYVARLMKTLWEKNDPYIFAPMFANYQEWLCRTILPQSARAGVSWRSSHFPGDLLVSLTLPSRMPLTVVGLNSTWLACRDDAKGRLEIATEQLQALLPADSGGKNPLQMLDGQANLLLMHHPLEWFSDKGKKQFLETLYIPERFLATLCGHRHTNLTSNITFPGENSRCYIQASSLFGLEHLGSSKESRSMGYTWGRLNAEGQIRIWPLQRVVMGGGGASFLHDNTFGEALAQGIPVCAPGQSPPSAPIDLTPWLHSLLDRTDSLEIRGIGSGVGRQKEAGKYPIEQLYTPLRSQGGLDERGARAEQKTIPLAELLPGRRRLLIEGQPGAGKTTFLKLVAAMLAKDLLRMAHPQGNSWREQHLGMQEAARYPLFLRLSELARLLAADEKPSADDRRRLLDLLVVSSNGQEDPAWRSHWEALLQEGKSMLLLDGLDEVADEGVRTQVIRIVQDAARQWENCPIIVTSRPFGVEQMKGLGFHHAVIDPFGLEEIRTFIGRWSAALHASGDVGHDSGMVADHQQVLLQAITDRPTIRRLAANPVMLTCLCVVHWNEGKLPEGRARVYQAVMRWLIAARSGMRKEAGYNDHFAMKAFSTLSLAMMLGGKRSKQATFGFQEGAEAIDAVLQRQFPKEGSKPERERLGRQWLMFECLGSGIVEEVGAQRLKFWHLTFQEYLAARAMAWLGDGEVGDEDYWPLLQDKLDNPQWRETLSLLPGTLFDEGDELRVDRLLSRVLKPLETDTSLVTGARIVGIMNRLLEPMHVYQYRPPSAIEQAWQTVRRQTMGIFTLQGARQLAIKMRVEVAEALGQSGDPRLNRLNLIEVPETGGWSLGKYPVTVVEYLAFVEQEGYQEQCWWCTEGWKIRMERGWENPAGWDDQTLHPNRPVVGVSWFEAMAYCRWLSEREKRIFRLPIETFWEKAVGRGRYPWGGAEPTSELANFGKNVGAPTPVGLYPAGDGPQGHCDLLGNVWEWQRNLHKAQGAKDTPTDPVAAAGDAPFWRGGSWFDPTGNQRAAYRFRYPAGHRFDYLGFRVAAAPLSRLGS
ncbi:MAG: SUMF1/EgtB/PvdO family nonheme iron enzyme [Magnetococcus sp. MYC-9]